MQPNSKRTRPTDMTESTLNKREPVSEDEVRDDGSLIQGALGGCDEDFRLLIERYENLVWQLLNRIVPYQEDREELAQDVFLRVYFKLSTFKFESKFSTWLYTVTYRIAISHLRKVRPESETFDEDFEAEDPVGASHSFHTQEVKDIVEVAIRKLSVDDRTIISLFHQQGCSIDEISAIVGKPGGTIKNQLFRVRQKLKRSLESELGREGI